MIKLFRKFVNGLREKKRIFIAKKEKECSNCKYSGYPSSEPIMRCFRNPRSEGVYHSCYFERNGLMQYGCCSDQGIFWEWKLQ